MKKTWMPMVAGILDIVAGALSFLLLALVIVVVFILMATRGASLFGNMPVRVGPAIILSLAIPIMVADVLAVVGGAYALMRKAWGLALAGSIAAVFASWPMGIAAIVLTVMSKNEFER